MMRGRSRVPKSMKRCSSMGSADFDACDASLDTDDTADYEDDCWAECSTGETEMTSQQQNLWNAASSGLVGPCEVLLQSGVNPNFLHSFLGNTPLHIAVENGHVGVIKTLINQGCCDLNMKDKLGRTAIMEAAIFDDVEIVHILHKGGADLDAVDNTGKTALLLCLQDACKHSLMYLIRHGCDLNIVDHLGQSALLLLMNSVDLDATKLVKKLIKSGYDVNRDKTRLQEEGMDVETVHSTNSFVSKISNKLRSRLSIRNKPSQRDVYVESCCGSTKVRILKTCE